MPFLEEKDKDTIRDIFKELTNPVKLINFTQELECQFCKETREIMEKVSALSDKISLEVYNFQLDKEKVAQFRVDKIPATAVLGSRDYGLRIYGIPSGYEFASFLETLVFVSKGESDLSQKTKDKMKTLTKPLHLQVFVTPT